MRGLLYFSLQKADKGLTVMERIHVYIEGIVQGVGFRFYVKNKAEESDVSGWVKNLSDGRVEIVAEGSDEALDTFVRSLQKGRLGNHIDGMEIIKEPGSGHFRHFYISYNENNTR